MEKIYGILEEIRPEFDFHNSKDFIGDGLLDSFDIVTLVASLDEEFAISIDGLDIMPNYFCTVKSIAEVVRKNGGNI